MLKYSANVKKGYNDSKADGFVEPDDSDGDLFPRHGNVETAASRAPF